MRRGAIRDEQRAPEIQFTRKRAETGERARAEDETGAELEVEGLH